MDKKYRLGYSVPMIYGHKNIIIGTVLLLVSIGWCSSCNSADISPDNIILRVTNQDQTLLFYQKENAVTIGRNASDPTITLSQKKVYQEIDGFGYTLTGGSALHLSNMSASKRADILHELFSQDEEGIGVSYLRVSIGASDLDTEPFSYDEIASGEDLQLEHFSIDRDRRYLIPVLKAILAINPDIKILGTPWSPPTWMKTNNSFKGGELKEEYYDAYAMYFVKYIQEMAKEGIIIDAITIQNEPLNIYNNPSMQMLAEDQANFVARSLGPKFRENAITTKIICYDHNADRPDYPVTVLNNREASKYIDGSAFHLYGGTIDQLSRVHIAFPDKNIYFTEQWVGADSNFGVDLMWHMRNMFIGATRNWSRTVLEWNLASDPMLKPHTTDGGCSQCLGALTIDGNEIRRNVAYYTVAHASKYVNPGSYRIESNNLDDLLNVAFQTPEGKLVLIVMNDSAIDKSFTLEIEQTNEVYSINIPQRSVSTVVKSGDMTP